jgi:hypothetical protein
MRLRNCSFQWLKYGKTFTSFYEDNILWNLPFFSDLSSSLFIPFFFVIINAGAQQHTTSCSINLLKTKLTLHILKDSVCTSGEQIEFAF